MRLKLLAVPAVFAVAVGALVLWRTPVDLALSPSLASKLAALENRIAILERTNQLEAATIRGGSLRVLDDTGAPVALLGEDADGRRGLVIYDTDGNVVATIGTNADGEVGIDVQDPTTSTPLLKAIAGSGLVTPPTPHGWIADSDPGVTITSGTFAFAWTTTIEVVTGDEVGFRVPFLASVGTTGEAEVTFNGVTVGGTKTISSGASINPSFRETLPGSIPLGSGTIDVALMVRRTSGAGAIVVYSPTELTNGSQLDSFPSGGWS